MKKKKQIELIRLNKYIANAGIASRRGADELIEQGKVKVNNQKVTEPGLMVSEKDTVIVNGQKLQAKKLQYLIFYKPSGYITTKSDPQERKTIYHYFPEELHHLKPAGRLDKDSTGLLILTNDGDLIQRLTHPKIHLQKIYRVVVEGKINPQEIKTLNEGIEIEKDKIAYADSVVIDYEKGCTTLEMTLYQGYNRQIRKMMEKLNKPVKFLKRIQHANIQLAGLKRGQYKFLTPKMVKELNNYINKVEKKAQEL